VVDFNHKLTKLLNVKAEKSKKISTFSKKLLQNLKKPKIFQKSSENYLTNYVEMGYTIIVIWREGLAQTRLDWVKTQSKKRPRMWITSGRKTPKKRLK